MPQRSNAATQQCRSAKARLLIFASQVQFWCEFGALYYAQNENPSFETDLSIELSMLVQQDLYVTGRIGIFRLFLFD